jgi:hypothetical protein
MEWITWLFELGKVLLDFLRKKYLIMVFLFFTGDKAMLDGILYKGRDAFELEL